MGRVSCEMILFGGWFFTADIIKKFWFRKVFLIVITDYGPGIDVSGKDPSGML